MLNECGYCKFYAFKRNKWRCMKPFMSDGIVTIGNQVREHSSCYRFMPKDENQNE